MPFLHTPADAATWLTSCAADARLRGACGALASRVRAARARTVGLVPAEDDVAVPGPAVLLGYALGEHCGEAVAVVDACAAWAAEAPPAPPGDPVALTWISERLAVLAPTPETMAGALHGLHVVCGTADDFRHLVVDLTGLERAGEQEEACELLDAAVLVARAGRTSVHSVTRWTELLSQRRFLGVLLTGA